MFNERVVRGLTRWFDASDNNASVLYQKFIRIFEIINSKFSRNIFTKTVAAYQFPENVPVCILSWLLSCRLNPIHFIFSPIILTIQFHDDIMRVWMPRKRWYLSQRGIVRYRVSLYVCGTGSEVEHNHTHTCTYYI